MVEEEFSPTGPKIHPERAEQEAIRNFLDKHKDIAEALLALVNPEILNFVRLKDLENAEDLARKRGIPYADAVRQEQDNIFARITPQFATLQNNFQVNQPFMDQYLRQKIQTDWLSTEMRDFELDQDDFDERVRKAKERFPDPDFRGELVDTMNPISVTMMLSRSYMFSQTRLFELYMELGNHIRQRN